MKDLLYKTIITLAIIVGGLVVMNRSNKDKIDPGSAEILTFEILEHINHNEI